MKFLVHFLVLAVVCSLAVADEDWKKFKVSHQKHYKNETDEHHCKKNFLKNKAAIDKCNEDNLGYKCAVNHLTDLSSEQVHALHKGLVVPEHHLAQVRASSGKMQSTVRAPNAAASVDWRTKTGVVGPVKNQGQCGSCYTFSANGALEGQYALKKGWNSQSLAEQQLVDCLSTGCNGGWMNNVFTYIKGSGVVQTATYPYTGVKSSCQAKSGSWRGYATGFVDVLPRGDDNALMTAVETVGPIAIAMDASGTFGSYSGGVYYNPSCNPNSPTHAMLLVGYGNDASLGPYWLIKNSWGTRWGENGYLRLSRKYRNHCGISNWASYPKV